MPKLFDVFFACAPKDYNKLPFVVNTFAENVEGWDNIIICSPITISEDVLSKINVMHYTFLDENVLPGVDRNIWRFRKNWQFQQHLKLFQDVTSDWYLTFDCDTIVNRKLSFYDGEKPIYYQGMDQTFPPYFTHMGRMINLEKIKGSRSFVADMNFIYRPFIREMLERNSYTKESFIKKSQSITDKYCCMGEPELYGTYCFCYHPDFYVIKQLKQAPFQGRPHNGIGDVVWSEAEILENIEKHKSVDCDTFSLHSWFNEGDQK